MLDKRRKTLHLYVSSVGESVSFIQETELRNQSFLLFIFIFWGSNGNECCMGIFFMIMLYGYLCFF